MANRPGLGARSVAPVGPGVGRNIDGSCTLASCEYLSTPGQLAALREELSEKGNVPISVLEEEQVTLALCDD